MEKILTARELSEKIGHGEIEMPNELRFVEACMIEFARMHVEAALYAKGKAMKEKSYEDSSFSIGELDAFTGDCYPLENIK